MSTAKETGKGKASSTKDSSKTTGTHTGKKSDKTSTGDKGGKATKTGKSSKTKTKASSSISINPAAGAGGISMISPGAASQTYIKIGDVVTFVWNYTSVLVTPSRVDVVATNTDGAWTITSNMTVKETGSVTWNTSDQATPLPMEKYTFVVYDSEEGATAAPKAGYLSPYQNYPFAMYSPRPAASGSGTFPRPR